MNDEIKTWWPIIAWAFAGTVTTYITVTSSFSRINRRMDKVESDSHNRISLTERDIKYLHESTHEIKGRVSDLEDDIRSRPTTPL
jgi:hypothetical protein